ncbi:MAG TPA: hypothetical protein VNG51_28955 [Ktedonobacteraceae bacterium]|nr:hypothetical protein [Ktedonobacteraceae bacterium]
MIQLKNNNFSRSLIFFSLALITFLTGCSSGITNTIPSTTPTPTLAGPHGKGPGSANLTATAQATPVATVCPSFTAAPANTSGWHVYTDSRFSFHVAIPPGWRAGSYVDGSGSDYIVFVFPPGDATPIGDAGLGDPEHFEIDTTLVGNLSSPANDPSDWRVEQTKITINGTPTALYDDISPDCGQVSRRSDNVAYGQHKFSLYMVSPPAKAKNDIALFLAMAKSFA